jgi:potassium-transporting ATPase KdpC subunit
MEKTKIKATLYTQIRPAIVALTLFTLLTGMVYPLLITGLAQAIFPRQANGSLIQKNGAIVGSALIGQPFDDPRYFWSRPSATSPYAFNGAASAGSNLGPTNPALIKSIQARIAALKAVDPDNIAVIPVDLITASGSGLDPDISLASANYQAHRVAKYRGLNEEIILALIEQATYQRQFGIFGEPRVNVLALNLALDELK